MHPGWASAALAEGADVEGRGPGRAAANAGLALLAIEGALHIEVVVCTARTVQCHPGPITTRHAQPRRPPPLSSLPPPKPPHSPPL
eukprot:5194877-Alexandrium_andersonii.AAC.1